MSSKKYKAKKRPQPQQVKPKPAGRNNSPAMAGNAIMGIPRKYVIPFVLFVLCFVLYGNTIRNGYALDDDIYTRKNVYVREGFSQVKNIFNKGSLYGFNGVNESNYRPLVLLDFMTEVHFFGLNNPHVFHFFNVLFFAFCCLLLYYLMRKIFRDYNPVIPLAVVLLFMFHPIHTEVVANIKSRDEILGLLFGLASFYFIFTYIESKKLSHYILSALAFICSVLSKEDSLTFILIIPLMLYFFTSVNLKKIVLLSLPYLGIIVVYMLIRSKVLASVTFENKMEVINNSLMAAKGWTDQLATEMMMMGKYIYMLVIPYPLSWDYSYNQIPNISFANIKAILSVLLYLAMGGYVLWSIKKKSVHAFAILFYLITIFLTSNLLVKVGSTFAERFLFIPSIGYCMSLPLLMASVFKINPKQPVWKNKNSYYSVLGLIMLAYAAILIPRNSEWKDNLSLFKAGVIAAPNSARTHSALGTAYRTGAEDTTDLSQKRQLFALAIDEYRKSIAIYDKDPDTYCNLGVTFYEDGMQDSALKAYQKAVAVSSSYTMAFNNMGVICFNQKQYGEAIDYFMKAYKADTNNIQYLANIGAAYQNIGNRSMALGYYNKVLQKDPHNANVANNVSIMYVSSGMQYFSRNVLDSAYGEFAIALKYNPGSVNALGNIGVVYLKKGDYDKAREYLQRALAIDPRNQVFQGDMAQLNAATQNPSK